MCRIRTPGYQKHDLAMRWALCRIEYSSPTVTCHILAYAFLEKFGDHRLALWLKPAAGFTGNHIFIASTDWIFDYHGGKLSPVVVPPGCQVLVDTGQGNASGQQARPDCGASVCVPSDVDTGRSRSAR